MCTHKQVLKWCYIIMGNITYRYIKPNYINSRTQYIPNLHMYYIYVHAFALFLRIIHSKARIFYIYSAKDYTQLKTDTHI